MKNIKELEKKCFDLKRQLTKMKIESALGKLSNTAEIRKIRREIAKIKLSIHMNKEATNG